MDVCTSMHYYLQKYHFYILYDIYGNSRGREGLKKKFLSPIYVMKSDQTTKHFGGGMEGSLHKKHFRHPPTTKNKNEK